MIHIDVRRASRMRLVPGALAMVVLAACSTTGLATGPPPPPTFPMYVALTISPFALPSSIPLTCPLMWLTGPIRLDARDRQVVGIWGERVIPIAWPPGFRAVFNPDFTAVIDELGQTFARRGDDINPGSSNTFGGRDACVTPGGIDFW